MTEPHRSPHSDEKEASAEKALGACETTVTRVGFEPTTYGLKVRCSTN